MAPSPTTAWLDGVLSVGVGGGDDDEGFNPFSNGCGCSCGGAISHQSATKGVHRVAYMEVELTMKVDENHLLVYWISRMPWSERLLEREWLELRMDV
jgi:hypothetical protein